MCVCVCLFVTSEFSGTGHRSAAPLSPTWRASPSELQRQHLRSTQSVLRERKPLELFFWQSVRPRPSRYNGAILKEIGRLPEKVSTFFAFNWDAVSKKNVFGSWKASLKLGGSCGVRGENGLWLPRCRPPRKSHHRSPQVVKQAYGGKVGTFSPLAETHKGRQTSWLLGKFR